jgi:5-methylcytosine-specific restriction endonuclease McrA
LLKEKALKADLNVFILQTQKLISKKEVNPIISQPKNKQTKLPEVTKKIILIINKFKKTSNRSTFGSYLK